MSDAFKLFGGEYSWRSAVMPELAEYSPEFVSDLLAAFERHAIKHPEVKEVWRAYLVNMARRRYNIEKEGMTND